METADPPPSVLGLALARGRIDAGQARVASPLGVAHHPDEELRARSAVKVVFTGGHEAGPPVLPRAKLGATMIPPYPMQLTLLGSALYRELCIGLLRALTAPWLDPGSLTRTADPDERPRDPSAVRPPPNAIPSPREARCPGAAVGEPAASTGRVIAVPLARWRRHRAGGASSVLET
jgi:hypothetical protein